MFIVLEKSSKLFLKILIIGLSVIKRIYEST